MCDIELDYFLERQEKREESEAFLKRLADRTEAAYYYKESYSDHELKLLFGELRDMIDKHLKQ